MALPDAGGTRAVVRNARRANPDAPILARVAREEEDDVLRRARTTVVVAPERVGAVLLLEESARGLGVPALPRLDELRPVLTFDHHGTDQAAMEDHCPA